MKIKFKRKKFVAIIIAVLTVIWMTTLTGAFTTAAGGASGHDHHSHQMVKLLSQSTLTAVADGYTKSDAPTTVTATTTPLRVDGSPTWNAYVKFDVPAGTVQSATLRLTAASTASSATDVKTSGSSWDETNLTYNTAPAPGSTLGSIASTVSGTAYDVTVTSAVTGGTTVSFAITTTSSTARTFNSREASTGKPELIVNFDDPPPPSTVDTMHSISQMEEDAVGGSFSTKARFEGRHSGTTADPYIFDMTVRQNSGDSEGMNLVFREISDECFYQLDIEQTQVLLREKIGDCVSQSPVMTTRATGCDGYSSLNTSYHVKMLLKGALFEVYEHNESTPCVSWTDPDTTDYLGNPSSGGTYPVGENASYYCMPGNYCTWEKVEARPTSIASTPVAWAFTGQDPGYYSAQTINGSGQSILESRYPYTVQNYRFGSSHNAGTNATLDHVEHAADGNVEYHLDEWSDFGTRIIYRATVGQYGYHVQFNNGSTLLKRKNLNGTTTTIATASPSVPLNRHVKVVVTGNRHQLIDETDCNPGPCTVYWDVTDSTYSKGNKTYWGNVSVNGASIRGSFRALP